MTRECPESRSGLHLWCGGDAALGNPRPHCIACKTDGDLGAVDDVARERPAREASFAELLIWFGIGGAALYLVLLAVPH